MVIQIILEPHYHLTTSNRIAVGVPFDDDSGTNRGSIIVYQYNTSTSSWDNIGQVVGKQSYGYFGFGVKMNKAGDRFVASTLDDQFGSDVRDNESLSVRWGDYLESSGC